MWRSRRHGEALSSVVRATPGQLVRRVRRAERCTIRLEVSRGDLEDLSGDVDRLLMAADDLDLSPPLIDLLLAVDDEGARVVDPSVDAI